MSSLPFSMEQHRLLKQHYDHVFAFQRRWFPNTESDFDALYLSNALVGEVGEFCSGMKKQAGGGTRGNVVSNEMLDEELADVFIYGVLCMRVACPTPGAAWERFSGAFANAWDSVSNDDIPQTTYSTMFVSARMAMASATCFMHALSGTMGSDDVGHFLATVVDVARRRGMTVERFFSVLTVKESINEQRMTLRAANAEKGNP